MSVEKDLVYVNPPQNPEQQSLDIYLPSKEGPTLTKPPLIVYVHSGFWLDRDKTEFSNVGLAFSKSGFAVAIVNYRTSKRVHNFEFVHPMHTQDIAHALKWLLEPTQVEKYGYDSNNVYLFGHSCGAHIVGLLSLAFDKYLAPLNISKDRLFLKGCIGVQGIYDLDQIVKDFPPYLEDVEFAFSKDRSNWESPQHLRNNNNNNSSNRNNSETSSPPSPPWLVIHSPFDEWVNLLQAQNFVKHLHDLKVEAVLDTDVTGDHMGVVRLIGSEFGDSVLLHVVNFIQRCS
eukprot:TRINITY_DN655_c0_g1_i2.p1 TRINITY_DN655_c0_g1~~TRINITY_DN655_c0_g1_i2.p1  ORF type:complete len:287 (+),score=76.32 TRINITY_DN655_c0_g1_i2:259-1119(+)